MSITIETERNLKLKINGKEENLWLNYPDDKVLAEITKDYMDKLLPIETERWDRLLEAFTGLPREDHFQKGTFSHSKVKAQIIKAILEMMAATNQPEVTKQQLGQLAASTRKERIKQLQEAHLPEREIPFMG
jgi:hypothetical protein